ncbi:MAG: glycosyltransferase family 39 protein [Thermoplasmatales archaeon]|nr:MAG: glycosyltransferase family 39 protein [Thermoplasmatales archaeon]
MRKRAQRKSKHLEETRHIIQKKTLVIEKKPKISKNWWIAVSLIAIFFLVLLFNSYFNINSGIPFNSEGEGFSKYYLSGPDPYYNMRIIDETLYGENAGHYQFFSEKDPLLNYPISTAGGRAPLFNMVAISFGRFLTPFMDEIDAVGYSMQFVPALFGALLIFPVYFIGKILFNSKAGLIGALLIVIIPIHLGSGHGSAYTLFDHDSFNLLLFFLVFLFLIKSIKEKNSTKSIFYAILAGIPLAGLSMTWVEAQFLYVVIAAYAFIQIFIDIFTSKMDKRTFLTPLITLLSGYLISLPVLIDRVGGFRADIPLFLCIGVAIFGAAYYIFDKKKIPWTLSLPTIFCVGGIGLTILYFIDEISAYLPIFSRLSKLSDILYGAGIYGNKVAETIAEANVYNISRNVMSFGPTLYWLSWIGFILVAYYYYKDKQRREYLFIIILFLIDIWLTGTAGRFVNDMVPLVAILGGWVIWIIVDKIDYKQMIRNIKSAGGGIHGLRRGTKLIHIFGILFISMLVIFPNAYLAFDAAVPFTEKEEVFHHKINDDVWLNLSYGAYGMSVGKELYWTEAYDWLNKQDTNIVNPTERPAYISWWDYGFYEVALGKHPTVADNFQDGIPTAANFHTATSEKEAVSIWIVRLLEGSRQSDGTFPEKVTDELEKYMGKNDSENITQWIKDPIKSPSYNTPIGEEYDEELSKKYPAGQQWPMNAVYHDITELLVDKLTDDKITWLYLDLQEITGYSIRYYGIEGYDRDIFDIFGFLADKSLYLPAIRDIEYLPLAAESLNYNPEDDFVRTNCEGYYINPDGTQGADSNWYAGEIIEMPGSEKEDIVIINLNKERKDAYFDTIFYKTYIGVYEGQLGSRTEPDYHLPCINMKHFCAEFISKYPSPYANGKSAVIIAKYYAGAYINGSVTFDGKPLQVQAAIQKNVTIPIYGIYGMNLPIDHDKIDVTDGQFNLIAPAGNITLQIRRYPNFGENMVILKNVTLSVSDEESMRKAGTEYERVLNITIDPANVSGYVYDDKDGVEGYNSSVDEPLEDITLTLHEILEDGNVLLEGVTLFTDEKGYYSHSDLMPGLYIVRAENVDGFIIYEELAKINPGDVTFDISKSKLSRIEGTVSHEGKKMSDVDVDLTYKKYKVDGTTIDEEIDVGNTQTNEEGFYSFSSLHSGQYSLSTIKLNATTMYPDYEKKEDFVLSEDETKFFNISIEYSSITVSGETESQTATIGNVTINFSKDKSIEDNTAVTNQATSELDDGSYIIKLIPGSYNITASKTTKENNQDVTYRYEGKIILSIGQGIKYLDIIMTKEE